MIKKTKLNHNAVLDSFARLSQSIGSCVRFNWLNLTGESRQFIHTVTVEALKLPINQ